MTFFDEAVSVAVEHVSYCRRQGMGAYAIIVSAGVKLTPDANPSWDDCVWLIARQWSALTKQESTFGRLARDDRRTTPTPAEITAGLALADRSSRA